MTSTDTANPHIVTFKHVDPSVQFEGTFNGGTVASMLGSMSNIAYSPCLNSTRANVSVTANTLAEIYTSSPYYKPSVTSGTSDAVTINLIYWVR